MEQTLVSPKPVTAKPANTGILLNDQPSFIRPSKSKDAKADDLQAPVVETKEESDKETATPATQEYKPVDDVKDIQVQKTENTNEAGPAVISNEAGDVALLTPLGEPIVTDEVHAEKADGEKETVTVGQTAEAVETPAKAPGKSGTASGEATTTAEAIKESDAAATQSAQPENTGIADTVDVADNAAANVPVGEGASQETPAAAPESYLDTTASEAVLANTIKDIGAIAKANATTKPASVKIKESEAAQVTPTSEKQATGNIGQVQQLAKKGVPQKSGDASRRALMQSLKQTMPKTLEDVDTFKKSNKGAAVSKSLMQQVTGDVRSVQNGFKAMGTKPKPVEGKKATPLPAPEQPRAAKALNVTGAILPTLKKEALETTQYTDGAKAELAKQGITQEQLDMVDSGDLAEAKAAKMQMDTDAAALPAEARDTLAKEDRKITTEAKNTENNARKNMRETYNKTGQDTGAGQVKAKTDFEKRRDAAAAKLNGIYDTCEARVIKKLADLETSSLRDFEAGQKRATKDFENRVERDKEAFKSKRYTLDLEGAYYWGRDLFMGIDELPAIKKIFEDAKSAYIVQIDALIVTITNRNNAVIKECKDDLDAARAEIAKEIKKLDPDLKEIGRKIQGDISKKLQDLTKKIDETKQKLEKDLIEKRAAAIKAIDKKIADMKKKMQGALRTFGAWIKDAAKKFFKWALELVGMDAESFFKTMEKAGEAIKAIFDDPGKFFSNLVAAVKGSIADFQANFKEYLTGSLFDWLTGAIGSIITLPQKWDLKGIISVILQVAGISWAFIRKQLVNIFGEEKVAYAEEKLDAVREIVQKFLTEGVAGIWDWIKDQAEMLMTTVVESIKSWLLTKLVVGFAEWIVSLLIPGGGLIKLIQGIYKLVMWFVDNIGRIMRWVNAIMGSIGNIAMGAIPAAIGFIVDAMKTMIPIILDFFAKLLNISGIVEAIQDIIAKVMEPIHKAIDKFVAWIRGKIEALVKKFKGDKKKPEEAQEEDGEDNKEKAKPETRSAAEMQKDLDEGVKEGTNYLKTHKNIKRLDIEKHLDILKSKYSLKELKLIVDKNNEKGTDFVHIHGEVNPKEDGEEVETELNGEKEINLEEAVERAEISEEEVKKQVKKLIDAGAKSMLFRADDYYRPGNDIGYDIESKEAKDADIGGKAKYPNGEEISDERLKAIREHVLDKQDKDSIFTSFSIRKSIKGDNSKFTKKDKIYKVALDGLMELFKEGKIKIYTPLEVQQQIKNSSDKKIRIFANDVYQAMTKNGEILIEGQIPAKYIKLVN